MQQRRSSERGVSLTELLTVVAIIGVIALITVPAMMQLMPQYRIRSAASDAGAGVRMIRQKAITTRVPWKISFDANNDRYKYSQLSGANAARTTAANWLNMGRDGRPTVGNGEHWIRGSSIDLRTATTNPFKDVDCDGYKDLIFLRTGEVAVDANGGGCGGGANLDFTVNLPSVVFAVDNNFVRFNRYYLQFEKNGRLEILARKE